MNSRIAAAEARCGPKQTINDEGTAPVLQIKGSQFSWLDLFSYLRHLWILVPEIPDSAPFSEPEQIVITMRYRRWILAIACVAIAVGFAVLSRRHFPKFRPDPRKVSVAQDEVYEVVVRDLITPADGRVKIRQIVFDENVLTELSPGADAKACQESARKNLRLTESVPQYNSLADKIYRVFHSGDYRPMGADTIQEFLEESCTAGRLSQTFHTDLPRVFVGESIQFEDWTLYKNGSTSFEQLLPEAGGIIALSHVGFDPELTEAIIVVS